MTVEIELPDGTVLEAPDGADPSAVAKAYLAKNKPQPRSFLQKAGDEIVGAGDAALALGTGAIRGIQGGLGTVGGLITGDSPGEAAEYGQRVMASGWQPRTEVGKEWMGALSNVFSLPGKGVDAAVSRVGSDTDAAQSRGELARALTDAALVTAGRQPSTAIANVLKDPVVGAAKIAGRVASAPVNAFRPSKVGEKWVQRAGTRPEQLPAVVDALRRPSVISDKVPNSGLTAGQLVADTPEGTVIQGLQPLISQVPEKGISTDFSVRYANQKKAIDAARKDLENTLAPERNDAIASIKARGGLKADSMLKKLSDMASSPVAAGNEVAGKIIDSFAKVIARNTRKDGTVDPSVIYEYRKTGLAQAIESAAQGAPSSQKWGKVHIGSKVRDVIDTSFGEGGGGLAWENYLKRYAPEAKKIDIFEETRESMLNPEQRTSFSQSHGPMESGLHGPSLLMRPAALTNYGLTLRRSLMRSGVDRYIADLLSDPKRLADVLAKVEKRPPVPTTITDSKRLLGNTSNATTRIPPTEVLGERAARAWGDARIAPESVPRLPSPDQPLRGGSAYAAVGQRPIADNSTMSTSELGAAISHPAGPGVGGVPRTAEMLSAEVPPIYVPKAADVASLPYYEVLTKALTERIRRKGKPVKVDIGESVNGYKAGQRDRSGTVRGQALAAALEGRAVPKNVTTAQKRRIDKKD